MVSYLPPQNQSDESHSTPFSLILGICVVVQVIPYIIAALKTLRQHGLNIQTTFSTIEKINLNWLRSLVFAYAGT